MESCCLLQGCNIAVPAEDVEALDIILKTIGPQIEGEANLAIFL